MVMYCIVFSKEHSVSHCSCSPTVFGLFKNIIITVCVVLCGKEQSVSHCTCSLYVCTCPHMMCMVSDSLTPLVLVHTLLSPFLLEFSVFQGSRVNRPLSPHNKALYYVGSEQEPEIVGHNKQEDDAQVGDGM